MIVRYEVTVSDMADVMHRAVKRREPRLGWFWGQRSLVSAVLTIIFASVIDTSPNLRIFAAIVFFAVAFGVLAFLQKMRSVRRRLERHVAKQLGKFAPFTFEIEITSASMITRQLGEETRRDWKTVEKITEASGGIEFDTRSGGLVFVRDTAFASVEERVAFLRLARQYAGCEIA